MSRKKPPEVAADPLRITEDDREILLGFDAQRVAAVRAAEQEAHRLVQRAHELIATRQEEYLVRLTTRLGIAREELGTTYQVNLDTLTIQRTHQ